MKNVIMKLLVFHFVSTSKSFLDKCFIFSLEYIIVLHHFVKLFIRKPRGGKKIIKKILITKMFADIVAIIVDQASLSHILSYLMCPSHIKDMKRYKNHNKLIVLVIISVSEIFFTFFRFQLRLAFFLWKRRI